MANVIIRNEDRIVTEQEIIIVKMLSEGLLPAQISIETGIKKRTLEAKIVKIKAYHDVKTVAALCVLFYKSGLIE